MRSNSAWRDHDIWVCKNHLPAVRYPAGQPNCWYAGCKSVRPKDEDRPERVVNEPEPVAATPAPAPRPAPPARPKPSPSPVAEARSVAAPRPEAQAPAAAAPAKAAAKAPVSEDDMDMDFEEVDKGDICAWPPCVNERRKRSKYCSRNCSNKYARWRHRQRQRDEDEVATT